MEAAIVEREQNGTFTSLEDFAARMDNRAVNKKLMESKDPDIQQKRQADYMRQAADPQLARQFLLRTSMIQSLRDETAIR